MDQTLLDQLVPGGPLDRATLNILLSKNVNDVNAQEKEKLINLYAKYVKNGGQNLDDTFFDVFTSSYPLSVVVIEGIGGTTDARALSYPTGNQIDTRRTLFIYRNTKNQQYQSYNRDGSPPPRHAGLAQQPQLKDLNNPQDLTYLHIPGTEQRTRTLKTPPPDAAPVAPSEAPPASSSSTARVQRSAAPFPPPAAAAPVSSLKTIDVDAGGCQAYVGCLSDVEEKRDEQS